MKRNYLIAVICSLVMILLFGSVFFTTPESEKRIKVGYIYVGDASTAYTYNFIMAEEKIAETYGDRVENIRKFNVTEGEEEESLQELINEGCEIIFGTSYGYGETLKKAAKEHPEIQFCQATCSNAGEKPVLSNYHTFMGKIFEGRYVSGVAAGMKLKEMIENGEIKKDEALIGYVGAFSCAEVISGYTAFFLGVRSVVPEAEMKVRYTNTWSDFIEEKAIATQLINEGCRIISQHSDTYGPAVACENAKQKTYHISYNQNMLDMAPTTSIIGCRINWAPYMVSAVGAVLNDEKIEEVLDADIHGTDAGAGFQKNWVQMLELNEYIAADGTREAVEQCIDQLIAEDHLLFVGDYIGVDPVDSSDTIDLNDGYEENKESSAPTFHYVLKDVIHVEE